MKRILSFIVTTGLLLVSCGTLNLDPARLMQSGIYAAQALTLTDAQVQAYVHQYVTQLDAQSTVLPESNAYTKRLRKLTAGLDGVNEVPLNFKVYKENEVNAFACADGSVRVYTGIMDAMTDNELLPPLRIPSWVPSEAPSWMPSSPATRRARPTITVTTSSSRPERTPGQWSCPSRNCRPSPEVARPAP